MSGFGDDYVPTARELAARANGSDPWSCPRCGDKLWRVESTYDASGHIRRRRVCRNCGQGLLRTTERPDAPEGFTWAIVPKDDIEDAA